MAELKDKVETSLNEARILVLGAQVLLGFQYESVFEPRFEQLTPTAHYLLLGGLALLLFALACFMAPAPFHWLACRGRDFSAAQRFTTQVVGTALLPFGLALSLDLYAAGELLHSTVLGVVAAAITLVVVLSFWYVWELWDARGRAGHPGGRQPMPQPHAVAPSSLSDKIKRVLLEARIVLPGAQALLGFQLVTMYMEDFDKLPSLLKYVHLAGLACIGLSMVLLMTPAAYHRLVEGGEDSERFLRLAGRLLLSSMVFLALGIAADFWAVIEKVSQSRAWGLLGAGGALLVFYGLWFGYSLYRRAQLERESAALPG